MANFFLHDEKFYKLCCEFLLQQKWYSPITPSISVLKKTVMSKKIYFHLIKKLQFTENKVSQVSILQVHKSS